MTSFNARRAWIIIGAFAVVFIALGPFLDSKGPLVVLLYKIGILGVPFAAILYTIIYTVFGLRGRSRWWTDDVGMAIVTPYIAITVSNLVLAYVELFHHGLLNTPGLAWIDIGGLLAAMLLMLWRSAIWLQTGQRLSEEERNESAKPEDGVAADGPPGGGGAAA